MCASISVGIAPAHPGFVIRLREESRFDSDCTDEEYMSNFADRYKELHGVSISDETPEAFLHDLISCGYASEII